MSEVQPPRGAPRAASEEGTVRATALVCMLLIVALAISAQADVTTSNVQPAGASGWEPVIRTGGCSLTAAERANLDPRLSNRGEPGSPSSELRDPPCDLFCEACWLYENEGPTADEYVDSFNGGCNSSPEVFWSVQPGYGPVTICGQGGNYITGGSGYRDTDWYELTFTVPREITVTCTAEFPVHLYIIDGNIGCSNPTVVVWDGQPECVEASVTYVCTPGTWWVWVGASEFTGWPNDADYILTIHGYDFECVIDCPGGVPTEDEPPCEVNYEDHHNGGCNSSPHVYQEIVPSTSTIVRCGESGFYDHYGSCYRDTDWYELVLDEPREVTACIAAEFPVQFLLAHPDPDCGNIAIPESVLADVCAEECITAVLDPGVHWLFVAPEFSAIFPCGGRYILSIEGYTTPVEGRTWGLIKSLYR